MKADKQTLFWLSTFTIFGFSIAGLFGIYFFQGETTIQEVIFSGKIWYEQVMWGIGVGLIGALVVGAITQLKMFESVSHFFDNIFDEIDLGFEDVFFYSFCAGVGEEIFFRAAVQPLMIGFSGDILGIWNITELPILTYVGIFITALIFVALHGYLNPKNLAMFVVGVLLVFFSAGIGWLFAYKGLLAAIIAHFLYDLLMFVVFIYSDRFSSLKK